MNTVARGLGFGSLLMLALLGACSSSGSGGGGSGTGGAGNMCPGQTACGTQCVDTNTDSQNCGGCGIPCSNGRSCQAGQCKCQPGLLECSGSCVPSDATHCGNCTTTCQASQVCSNNACMSGCAAGQTLCGTACADTTSSNTDCGSCAHACGANQHCASSACVDNSTSGVGGSMGTGGMGGATGAGGATPAGPKLITSAPSGYWNTTGTITTVTTGNATVTVNDATAMKTFEGFGGAFNEMGWNYLSMLSATDRDRAIKLLFDANDGAHFVMGRIPIGASDYAIQRYTDDETPNDTSMANFSITQDMKYLIPYVKAAQAVNGNIRFWASPWTPPSWMKTKTGTVNGTSCGNVSANGITDTVPSMAGACRTSPPI